MVRLLDEPSLSASEAEASKALRLALLLNGGACALKESRYDAALSQSEAALAISPTSVKALFRKGQALHGMGRKEEAETALVAVTEREPNSREAHNLLAAVRAK